jgi:hypothetical protein
MSRRLLIVVGMLVFSTCVARAQSPTPEAMTAARNLVATLKLTEQYRAQLPVILLGIRPALVQDRPEMERDFDALAPTIAEAYAPHYAAMVDAAAKVYASNFSLEELRDIEAFYHRPAGQKLLTKSQAITDQVTRATQEVSRKAADDLRTRLAELLRQKAKKQ